MSVFDRASGVLATRPRPVSVDYKKAVTQDSAPTIIEAECSERLIDYVQDCSVLLGLINVIRMNRREVTVNFIDVSDGLLRPGGCATDDSDCDTGTITATRKTLRTEEIKAVIPVCDDVLEDNIEGAALEDHLIRMVAKKIATELEILALMAGSGYNSPLLANSLEADWAAKPGFYEELQGGHVLNGLTATDGRFITPCKIQQMLQTLPVECQCEGDSGVRLFMPLNMKWDWIGYLAGHRQTDLGDQAFTGGARLGFNDLPFVPLPLIPTDILSCSVGSAVGSNGTFMFLANPDNLFMGIQRDITFERERKACQGRTFLIWTLRVDFLIENTDCTVLYDCMDVGQCNDCPCP